MEPKRQSEAVERLVGELASLLEMLDGESLSAAAARQVASVRDILDTLQASGGAGSDVYVNGGLDGNGTSFVESLFEGFDCDLQALCTSPVLQGAQEEEETHGDKSTPTDTPPPLPATPLPEDYYEEALPLEPDSAPQHFGADADAARGNSEEDAYYEDADNNYPTTRINGPPQNSYNDSDAVSSSYESYEEDDEAKTRGPPPPRWSAADGSAAGAPVGNCRICAFLPRKKRFGQWAKQLVVVRDDKLQCYKSVKESTPHTEIPLDQCSVLYVNKDGRKKKRHELRFSLPAGEVLVLAVQSREQAQRWIKAVRGVGGDCGSADALDASTPPVVRGKTALVKMPQCDRHASDSDGGPAADCQSSAGGATPGSGSGPGRDAADPLGKAKRGGALSELTGSVSRAAGKTIHHIITFSKRKPPPALCARRDDPGCGYLGVCVGGVWKECWCTVRAGNLNLHREPGDRRAPVAEVPLRGAEVVPGGLGPKRPFSFRILQGGAELATLEAGCSQSLGRWLGVLLAETGGGALPEELHYDYADVDTLTDIRHAARRSFLWATGATYDEVYESVESLSPREAPLFSQRWRLAFSAAITASRSPQDDDGDGPPARSAPSRRRASFSSRDSDRTEQQAAIKRHASNVNQYARYGKLRAEDDARRYVTRQAELERQKDALRRDLHALRADRKNLKESKDGRVADAAAAERRLVQLEALCRQKEEERVELELELTRVKENLNKSLARGAILAPPTSATQVCGGGSSGGKARDLSDCGGAVPVNSASELRKRPPSLDASSKGNVMQKAKEWESKTRT